MTVGFGARVAPEREHSPFEGGVTIARGILDRLGLDTDPAAVRRDGARS